MKIVFLPAKAEDDATRVKTWVDRGLPKDEAKRAVHRIAAQRIYLSECGTYQANVEEVPEREGFPRLTWVSFKRVDREPISDWRVKQAIKNAIVGPEAEAVELYPAESRLVDSSNQYHLWVLPSGMSWPFGYRERLVTEEPLGKSKQRPFADSEDEERRRRRLTERRLLDDRYRLIEALERVRGLYLQSATRSGCFKEASDLAGAVIEAVCAYDRTEEVEQ